MNLNITRLLFYCLCAIVILPVLASANDVTTIKLFDDPELPDAEFDHLGENIDPKSVWSVKDGILICQGNPIGLIRSKQEFANYQLSFQWRWAPNSKGGNSGLLIHCSTPRQRSVWPRCLEVQLQADRAGDFILLGETIVTPNENERKSGLRIARLPEPKIEKPIGEWNSMTVIVKGDEVHVSINGKTVNQGAQGSSTKGAIALQSEGAEIHFKEILVTPLDK